MSRQEDFKQKATEYNNNVNMHLDFYNGAEYGYQYAVDKALELIEKLCDSHNIVSIKDGKYKSRSWLEEQFRKTMQ